MSSIRPLVTITILVVVGAYLYVKINEGAVSPAPAAGDAWNQPPGDVPPLATSDVAPTTNAAPAPTTTAAPPTAATIEATPAGANAAAQTPPAVPAIPEIPEIGTTTQADTPPAPSVTPPTTAQTNPTIGALPPASAALTASASFAAQEAPTTPEQLNAASTATSGLTTAPLASQPNPLRQGAQPTSPPDRYAAAGALTTTDPITPAATTTPVATSFVESWPTIQAALDRGELAEAHKLLSQWYGDPSLTPTDAERVESLLSQLAGTVVYSTEHQLAPAHVVKPGETLETIAKEYNVPWQLLAKINGIPAADQVRAGQELKVVRGPFSAVVELSRNQLTLMVDGRYAGKFPVATAPGQSISDGEWVVGQKHVGQATERAILLQGNAGTPGTPAPTLIIASESLAVNSANGSTITVSTKDAEELSDILSIGSRVVTRR
ncbi:MAG: LysM peptidoglycan-binding domain-containing protein [Planctomycetes bacterium]|nr:LysM peptidoglycan-binding domain-containing protein [Planctomycetota bacterium]